ncbi:interferon lambda receptor 1 [Callospermophilus lateralis]|uniref:interferon lambda receptor 1 n=1 Tax=Callospermophilus lateralis TaxID=76772 RepID=UPI004038C45B
MSAPGRWAPLLLGLLLAAPGSSRLAPPRNVTLLSQNFSVYLTWLPGLGNPQNVTYFVAYQSSPTPRKWQKVKKCAGTRALVCPLMCLKKQDLYNKFKARVQAASGRVRSPWVESASLDYLSEVEPAPPTLVFTQTKKILRVNATYQLPPCMPLVDLTYKVEFWKEGTTNKTVYPATPHGQTVQVPLPPATSRRYCLSARTIYTFISPKYSNFSTPICFFLEAPGPIWAVLVLPSLLPLLLVVALVGMIWKSLQGNPWFRQSRMPQALDFSGCRRSVLTFQSSGPESLDDLFLCPQKELIRKVRPAPQVRAPDALKAGSEEKLAEDEDDDVSLQPYIEHPSFLGQALRVSGHSEAHGSGVDSGRPWTLVVPGEGSSAWDSSDRSWPSTVYSSPWDEAGSSSYLAKKRPGQGLSGDQHPELLSYPEFPEDLGSLGEPLQGDLFVWTTWGSSSPGRNLLPGEPQVSLRTLTFCWDSSPDEEEEEEQQEEEEGEREAEVEGQLSPGDRSTDSSGAEGCQRTEVRSGVLGHYMAR